MSPKTEKKPYYFTFGYGHTPGCGHYTVIEGIDQSEARAEMHRRYGDAWAFCYNSAEKAGVEKYNLKEITRITYTRQNEPVYIDNTLEVCEFIGPQPSCSLCNNQGEYEGEDGPLSCNECNSRLIPFINAEGIKVTTDWGDTIEKRSNGLYLIKKEDKNALERSKGT